MAEVTLAQNDTGNTAALTEDNVFAVTKGAVLFSTDAGTTWIQWSEGEKVIFATGRQVYWKNERTKEATFKYMAI
jgi:hypothetical protein